MHNPSYVHLSRTGILYFRWPLPKRLHPAGKASTIKVSLRTRDPKEALRLARFLSYAAYHMGEQGIGAGMNYSEVRATLHRHFKQLLENQRNEINEHGPLSPLDKSVLETSYRTAGFAAQGDGTLSIVADDDETIARFIEKYKLPVQVGTQQHEWLRTELYKSYRDYCRDTLAYNASLDVYDYSPMHHSGKGAEVSSQTFNSVPLKEIIEGFITQHIRSKTWQQRSENLRRAQLSLLIEFLGSECDVKSIGKSEARNVVDKLQKLPKNMKKSPAFRDKTIPELLVLDHKAGMGVSTLNDYIGTYSMLFAWAKDRGLTDEDPFNGQELPTPKISRNEKRQAFTNEQLRLIEHTLLTDLDGVKPKLSHKWASLIAMYTGARAGEVCQLTSSDIQDHGGVLCFYINDDDDGKRVKTDASVRLVPVHSRLIELGLQQFVNDRNDGRLFPDYTPSPNYGLSKNLSTWFNTRLLTKLDLKSKQLVMHCLRHTMNTKLHHADVSAEIVKAITGHADNSMSTGVYFGAGFKPQQLQDAIERFSFPSFDCRQAS